MGFRNLQIKLPTEYGDDDIRRQVRKQLGLKDFSFVIEKKSLDARKKDNIHWLINLVVSSPSFRGPEYIPPPAPAITYRNRKQDVVVVGSGPAGFFAAYVLQLSGYHVTLLERGSTVSQRGQAIDALEGAGHFTANNNYAFGEGGAGTFSDGKLTSRSKHISAEKMFFLNEYVSAGAPEEIMYMAHPHVGTDNLKVVVPRLREKFVQAGGSIHFDTLVEDLVVKNNKIEAVLCSGREFKADHVILATGHSAYETYRMLMRKGVGFRTKHFAIGHRIEHPQVLINRAQWGYDSLPGVKAAEYRLAMKTMQGTGVYTFCMCPGGTVVPASAYDGHSIVNGMSYYQRNGSFANAGIVAGVHPDMLSGKTCTPEEALDWMDEMEQKFFALNSSFAVPACPALDYIGKRRPSGELKGSYPRGLVAMPLYSMLPEEVVNAISDGLMEFARKLKGFDQGILMGFESKTSSPIQVIREENARCSGFDNLYFVGEGSGYAGGIVSSAADGIRCALGMASD